MREGQIKHVDLSTCISLANIAVPIQHGIEFIKIGGIIRLEAARAYCHIYLIDGRHLTVSNSLKEMEEKLPVGHFVRIHISHIVYIPTIQQYIRNEGHCIILHDGTKLPLAQNRKDPVLEIIKNYAKGN